MKKTLSLAILLLGSTIVCFSQNAQFQKGQKEIQAGISFLQVRELPLYDNAGIYKATFKFPQPFLSFDYGITDAISLGGYVTSAKGQSSNLAIHQETFSFTNIGVRGLYHVDVHELFDIYGGVGIGSQSLKSTVTDYFFDEPPFSYSKNYLTLQAIGGGRYRFADTVGAFLELSYGTTSLVNIGLNLKF
jgi:opacity protein-like surface antigen